MGASAVASIHGEGTFERSIRIGVQEDQAGLASAKALLSRAIELHELIHQKSVRP
jgi:hypothetical protein